MPKDFSPITVLPGRKFGRDRIAIIGRRYLFAASLAANKRVLEVGCGPGLGLGWLSDMATSVVAGDVTTATLAQAKATYKGRPRIRLVQFDGAEMPFQDASFDLVVAMAMINYLDAGVFLDECRRVLAEAGIAAFCLPNRRSPGFRPSRFSTRYYSVTELHTLARQHGFDLGVFGGFPALEGRARLAQCAVALGGAMLDALPLVRDMRERVREIGRRMTRYGATYLNGELTRAHMGEAGDIPLVRLQPGHDDFTHRILYVVARRR